MTDKSVIEVPERMVTNSVFADLCARLGYEPVAAKPKPVEVPKVEPKRVPIDWSKPIEWAVDGLPDATRDGHYNRVQIWRRDFVGGVLVGLGQGAGYFDQRDELDKLVSGLRQYVGWAAPVPAPTRRHGFQVVVDEYGCADGRQIVRQKVAKKAKKVEGGWKDVDWGKPLELADGTPIKLLEGGIAHVTATNMGDGPPLPLSDGPTSHKWIAIEKNGPWFAWGKSRYPEIQNAKVTKIDPKRPVEFLDGTPAVWEGDLARTADGSPLTDKIRALFNNACHGRTDGVYLDVDGTYSVDGVRLRVVRNVKKKRRK